MSYNDLNQFEGLQFIPINGKKVPTIKEWQISEKKHNLDGSEGVGMVCGKLSGYVEVIDIDSKYDLTGKMFDNFKRLIHDCDNTILGKLVVQKTRNNGYHLIYRCSVIAGNLKLANRPTSEAEKQKTFDDEYKYHLTKSKTDEEAKKLAIKARDADKNRVLIETRGEGGYIACFPTKGYELIHGDYYSIQEITPDQRDTLHGIARQFNTYVEEIAMPTRSKLPKMNGLTPLDDYNKRGDVVGLLETHGWKVVKQKGSKTMLLRAGQTTAQTSGNFDHDKNWFTVFTTSTVFEPQKAYLPYNVFAMLECNGDFSETVKRLYELGYGDRLEEKKPAESTRAIKSRVDPNDNDYSFLATPADYDGYLQQVIDGTLPQGLTTGSPELDKFFLFKESNLVMVNGIDNVGKSSFMWYLMLLAAMYHDWHGIIFSSENTLGGFMRKMIQFYWGKQLRGSFAMSKEEYTIAKKFIEDHFILIKAQEDLYNYKDIINMVRKARVKYPKLKYAMIDPYNSLKIDLSGFSKLSTHEYHYEALSEIKSYGQQSNFGWFVTHHAYTAAARQKDGDKKYPVAPKKEDTEHGVKVPNKADDFITIHRVTAHADNWKITEVHVRKIKDTETGGRVTPLEQPIKFEMHKGGCGFIEKMEMGGYGIDPVEAWHNPNNQQKSQPDSKVVDLWYNRDNEPDIDF